MSEKEFSTIHGTTKGKPVGYMKIGDQEFLLRESHVANLNERLFMYRLLMKVAKEADAEKDPLTNVSLWKVRRMLLWSVILKPNSKACSYERLTNTITEDDSPTS